MAAAAANLTSSSQAVNSTHRLPTVSASQALLNLTSSAAQPVLIGHHGIDRAVAADSDRLGLERGKVVEIWGPAGAGKTTLAYSAALTAVRRSEAITWIDARISLSSERLQRLANSGLVDDAATQKVPIARRLCHLVLPTLSHLLALIVHPPDWLPSQNSALLVIDGLNALLDVDYPRQVSYAGHKTEQRRWQAGRRYAILHALITGLNKIAVLHNIAIIVTTGCSSRMRNDSGLPAALGPGVGGAEWEAAVWTRLVVFRDFGARFVAIQKARGRNATPLDPTAHVSHVVGFEIDDAGVVCETVRPASRGKKGEAMLVEHIALGAWSSPTKAELTSASARKRTFEEIADSDDEGLDEFGWLGSEEHALATEGLVVLEADDSYHVVAQERSAVVVQAQHESNDKTI